jgi:D-alanyl-D-alanine carboxypeptidase (penicillin-binding protein 5/6)
VRLFLTSILFAIAGSAGIALGQRPPLTTEEAAETVRPGEPGRMPEKFRLLQPGQIPLMAEGAIVIDAFTGEPLYEKNADLPLYPASTTKILTALLVIEAGDLDREVLITEEDARVGESSLSLRAGDRYTRRQMLFGLMLKSANDVAHALARDNAGTMPAFALKMTQRARDLGAAHSSFMNPHGLHHSQHFTTARDLALIARHAMQQPLFRQIVSTQRFAWHRYHAPPDPSAPPPATPAAAKSKNSRSGKATPPPGPEIWALSNHNRLLTRFEGCTGIKTGYTNPARHTLVSSALRNGREVIAAVLKSGKLEKWEDSMLLLTHGLEHPPAH